MRRRSNNHKLTQQWLHLVTELNNTGVALTRKGLFLKAVELFKALATANREDPTVAVQLTQLLLDGKGLVFACDDNAEVGEGIVSREDPRRLQVDSPVSMARQQRDACEIGDQRDRCDCDHRGLHRLASDNRPAGDLR